MKTAFGLDPSGYSRSNTGFAQADLDGNGTILVTVYDDHVFGQTSSGSEPIARVAEGELEILRTCLGTCSVLVDIPIDLQGLPDPTEPYFTWQLAKRPVDHAFGGLAPLASLTGAPVSRFRHLLLALREDPDGYPGDVLETYPAATLRLLGLWRTGYGRRPATFTRGRWKGGPLACVAGGLGMVADEGETLTGDEFDAAICAITGVVDRGKQLAGAGLGGKVLEEIGSRVAAEHRSRVPAHVPENYVLMKEKPGAEIRIVRRSSGDPGGPGGTPGG